MKKAFLAPLLPAAVLLFAGCNRQASPDNAEAGAKVTGERLVLPPGSPALSSIAAVVAEASTTTRTRLNGRLLWNDDITVRVFAPFAGRVARINVEPSHPVAAGDTLALIASPDYAQAQADAVKARADYLLADQTLQRQRLLLEHGAVAEKDVQAAAADFERARSERERAESTLRMRGGSTDITDEAFPLKSPIAGVVVEKNINPGQEVRPDQMLANAPQFFAPLFVVSDPTHLWVQVDATEHDLPRLKPGLPLVISSASLPGQSFAGQVDVVSDSLDAATRRVMVRGHVDNPQRLLKAEMFVGVEFESPGEPGVELPATAVFIKGEKHFAYVEQAKGDYVRREVQVGPEKEGRVLVTGGLQAGERVVTDGNLLLDQMQSDAGGN